MNRLALAAFAALAITVATAPDAAARPRPAGSTKSFEANKKFGAGLELGDVFGLNGKYFLSPSGALDFGLGAFGYGFRNRYAGGGLHLYADYLWHPLSLTSQESFELPLYIGIGGRMWSYDYRDANRNDYRDYAFGVRVPIGIAFDFNNVPLDIFIQIVPTLDFAHRYYNETYLDLEFSVGVRYWFN